VTRSWNVAPRGSRVVNLSREAGGEAMHPYCAVCPGNGALYLRVVAIVGSLVRARVCSWHGIPKVRLRGTKSGASSLPSKERVHQVSASYACVGSRGGRGSRIRAAGQPVVCGGVSGLEWRKSFPLVVRSSSALFAGCVRRLVSVRFTAEYRSSLDYPGRH
jgi:hypothetical protein